MSETMRRNRCSTALLVALLATAGTGFAQEGELPPGMTAEMMEAWAMAANPGAEHEMLAAMAGSWTFTGTFWMAPGAPPQTTAGTSERKMILGGRVLVEKVKSEEMLGQSFEGFGLTGHDNVSGEYWGTWSDSMGTGMMLATGTCSDDGACEFTGTYNDPFVGGPKTVRMTSVSEDGREVHKMYDKTPDGEEFMSMELVYTRAAE